MTWIYENVRSSRFFPRAHELFQSQKHNSYTDDSPAAETPPWMLLSPLLLGPTPSVRFHHAHRYPVPLFAFCLFLLSVPDADNK